MNMNYVPSSKRYASMIYNYCGKSGLKLPAISLGLWHNFGDVDNFENSRHILLSAFDSGVAHFDLANNYGPPPGSAEKNLGVILNNDLKNYRDELIISTKAGYKMWDGPYGEWGSRKYLLASLDQSLKRMRIDYVDIFYSHRPDPDTPLEETMSALNHAVKQGKALYAGISNYNPEQTRKAAMILRESGTPCLIHQPKYSMFVREAEHKLLDVLEEEGIGSIAFSPLAQGLLTDKYLHGIPEGSRAAKPHGFLQKEEVTGEKINKIRKLDELAKKRNQSLAQMAIAWILRDKRITSVLVGVSSVDQLNDNLNSLNNLKFDPQELKSIDAILK
jgi:L-glyceraldehyde 3-phosphate reductase